MVAPASMTASTTRQRKSISVLAASSGENSTSPQTFLARRTPATALATTSSSFIRSLNSRWIELVARKTWILGCAAALSASQARSMSSSLHRASPQTVAAVTTLAMSLTLAKSPGEAIGNPASITSTPSCTSAWAISSFSVRFMLAPGDCSPSRSVVSKMRIVRGAVIRYGPKKKNRAGKMAFASGASGAPPSYPLAPRCARQEHPDRCRLISPIHLPHTRRDPSCRPSCHHHHQNLIWPVVGHRRRKQSDPRPTGRGCPLVWTASAAASPAWPF